MIIFVYLVPSKTLGNTAWGRAPAPRATRCCAVSRAAGRNSSATSSCRLIPLQEGKCNFVLPCSDVRPRDFAFKTCVFFGATCTDDIEIECTEESSRLGAFLCTGSREIRPFKLFQQDAVNQRWDPSRRTRHKSLPDTDTEESA